MAPAGAWSGRGYGADHLGAHSSGRLLIVAVRRVSGQEWLIVGARDMYPSERVDFVRWEEAHHG
jgi:hypothetical protein